MIVKDEDDEAAAAAAGNGDPQDVIDAFQENKIHHEKNELIQAKKKREGRMMSFSVL